MKPGHRSKRAEKHVEGKSESFLFFWLRKGSGAQLISSENYIEWLFYFSEKIVFHQVQLHNKVFYDRKIFFKKYLTFIEGFVPKNIWVLKFFYCLLKKKFNDSFSPLVLAAWIRFSCDRDLPMALKEPVHGFWNEIGMWRMCMHSFFNRFWYFFIWKQCFKYQYLSIFVEYKILFLCLYVPVTYCFSFVNYDISWVTFHVSG